MSSFEWMELQTLTSDIETARTRLQDARKRRDQGRIRALEDEITKAERRRLQLVAHISTSIATAPEEDAAERGGAGRAAAQRDRGSEEPEAPPTTDAAVEAEAVAEIAAPAETAPSEPAPDEVREATEASPPLAEAEPAAGRKATEGVADDEAPADGSAEPEARTLPDETDGRQIEAAAPAAPPASMARSLEGGTTMWDQLTPTDIDRAKRELGIRRAEILARHAEELKALEVEQGQIDTLEQAIASFLQKFNAAPDAAAVVKLDQERELRQQGNS